MFRIRDNATKNVSSISLNSSAILDTALLSYFDLKWSILRFGQIAASFCRSVAGEQEQLAVKALNLTSVFSEVDRLKEENERLEKMCNDRAREIDLMRYQVFK